MNGPIIIARGRCADCGGRIYVLAGSELDEWVHFYPTDYTDRPHLAVPVYLQPQLGESAGNDERFAALIAKTNRMNAWPTTGVEALERDLEAIRVRYHGEEDA